MLIKSGSLFFRFSLFVSFLVGSFGSCFVWVAVLLFFSFPRSVSSSLCSLVLAFSLALRFLFLFSSALCFRAFSSRSFFPCSLLLARFCARGVFLCSFLRLLFLLAPFRARFVSVCLRARLLLLVSFGSLLCSVLRLFSFFKASPCVRARFGLLRRWFRALLLLLCSWSGCAPFSLAFSCFPCSCSFLSCLFLPFFFACFRVLSIVLAYSSVVKGSLSAW